MRTRYVLLTIAAAVAAAGLLLVVTPATAQAPAYRAPRAPAPARRCVARGFHEVPNRPHDH